MNEQMQTLSAMLERSQWLTPLDIQNKQARHFLTLVTHACQTVPFYQKHYLSHLKSHGSDYPKYPILTREMIQAAADDFICQELPAAHGQQYPQLTSGSTGKAVRIISTDFTRLFYDALMLREHAWHNRDYSKKLVAIRWAKRGFGEAPNGHVQDTWGPPINQYKATGSSVFMNVASDTGKQIEGILNYMPQFIMSYPSQLAALADACMAMQIQLPFLEEVRTTGETFNDSYIKIISQAWPHVKITDIYSSVEIGNIAQQCAEYKNYHVNAEGVLLEIVDDENNPCETGKPGRVLVTSLLNYATPVIRYEIGDYAEWGDPCKCGRGLPVIRKILGRKRNRIIFPDGESRFPYLGEREEVRQITQSIRKFQIIQHTTTDIEIKLVVLAEMPADVEIQYKKLIQKNLGYPFNINVTYHEDIPTGPTGKYEEFVSLV